MIQKDFIDLILSTGMATLKELRRLMMVKDEEAIPEFDLLSIPSFDQERFAKLMEEKYKIPYVDLRKAKVAPETVNLIRKKTVLKYRAIPVQVTSQKVTLAVMDPQVTAFKNELGQELKKPCEFIITNIDSWRKLSNMIQDSVDDLVSTIMELKPNDEHDKDIQADDIGQDVVTFVNRILADAYVKNVSDIHVEPYEKSFRVRFRLDGSLIETFKPPRSMMLPMISRLKIMASLDISEKRKPQDGRIKLSIGGSPIDYRVSTLPTLFGEKVVLRLLDQSNLQLDMTKLGFESKQLEVFKEAIHRPFGMVLVTGPTGSGKTTTLYSALSELNKITTNISTAEDPCEFNLEGINQVNVRKEAGLTYAAALKSFLRQDPDIIMVGEIRDYEVAEIAVEAALTGHMVLSTLHTNDACATVTRLVNMGIEPFLVTSSLNAVVAQRLCRRICLDCREEVSIGVDELVACGFARASAEKIKVFKGKGCDTCNGTGYKGRVAIYEVLPMTIKIKEIVIRGGTADDLKFQAIKDGMKTMRMSALTKVAQGLTTIEEALANSASDAKRSSAA